MSIKGPLVGSSAKKETGESSMKAAGLKVGLTTPFKMSDMIGRGGRTIFSFTSGSKTGYQGDSNIVRYGWSEPDGIGKYMGGNRGIKEATIREVVFWDEGDGYYTYRAIIVRLDKKIPHTTMNVEISIGDDDDFSYIVLENDPSDPLEYMMKSENHRLFDKFIWGNGKNVEVMVEVV